MFGLGGTNSPAEGILTLQHNLLRHREEGHFHSDLQALREYLDDFLNGEFLPVKYPNTALGAGELCLQKVKWRFGEQHCKIHDPIQINLL